MRTISIFIFLLVFLSGCVSKKKHLEQVALLENQYATDTGQLTHKLDSTRGKINRLELQLAERKGENNALTAMQDKLQARIDLLEEEIQNTSNKALSTKESLNQNLKNKDREITRLRQLLVKVNQVLDNWESQMTEVAGIMQDSLQSFDPQLWRVESVNGNTVITLQEALLFRSNSTSRFEEEGMGALEKISEVIQRYPNTQMYIIAHTDNKPPRNRSHKDNWNYSTLRAAAIARLMTEEFYVGANQITAAGKGEFAPVASNETPEGQEQNRRVELVVSPLSTNLIRAVRKELNIQ